jgi:hypothetical protein
MNPLEDYLPINRFAVTWDELDWHETIRFMWQMSFTLMTVSIVGAIITGENWRLE